MHSTTFELPRPGTVLKGTVWHPLRPRALVLIEHGMADHHQRYADFAARLVSRDIAVYSYDKRGHGLTAGLPGSPEWQKNAGWFAERHGWRVAVEDSLAVLEFIRGGGTGAVPGDLPLFLFGHSMGSLLARDVAAQPACAGLKLAGLILSATAGPAGLLGVVGKVLAAALVGLRGPDAPSPFLDKLTMGKHAQTATGHKLPRTVFEWLSRDQAEVDRYIADPWCGNVMATSFYRDLVVGLAGLFTRDYARRFPRDLPVLMFSGDQDPVGGMGKGVNLVHAAYQAWGVKDLSYTLFPGGRHEMLNETNRQEVYGLVAAWIAARLPAAG